MSTRRSSSSRADLGARYLPSAEVIQKRTATLRWLQERGFDRQFVETMMQHDIERTVATAKRMLDGEGRTIDEVEVWFYELLDD